jgi:hypothetical protein
MSDLFIPATNKTPEISFSKNGKLQIRGYCIPEDANAFFSPLNEWLEIFLIRQPKEITLSVSIEYINTSSFSYMIRSIKNILISTKNKTEVDIVWKYDPDDSDAL